MRFFFIFLFITSYVYAQEIPARWDELTASDWDLALERSSQTCILPISILEKHGPHAPMGTDVFHVREYAERATEREYAVVFPDYIYGQVFEARQTPGTIAIPSKLILELLQATCDEIARNGFKKIMIINGHGGNPDMIRYFVQTQLERRRDYVVYFHVPGTDPVFAEKVKEMRKSDAATDQHAGENETSSMLYLMPDLVHLDRATQESGENQARLKLPNVYTGIWWYANYPNHYAGEGAKATEELGKLRVEHSVDNVVNTLKAIKADTMALKLQNEYFENVYGRKNGQ